MVQEESVSRETKSRQEAGEGPERLENPERFDGRVFDRSAAPREPRTVWRIVSQPLELKRIIALVAIIALAALVVLKFDAVLRFAGTLWGIAVPLLAGAAFAYLLNLVMIRWEAVVLSSAATPFLQRARRMVAILLSLLTVGLVATAAVLLVSGEIGEAFTALGKGFGAAVTVVGNMLSEYGLLTSDSPLKDFLPKDVAGWQQVATEALAVLGGAGGILSSALGVSGHVAGAAIDAIVTVVFAVYLLSSKEKALAGACRFGRWVLNERVYGQVEHACRVANHCFSRFIVGQCTEAFILGCLVALGMTIFGFPYVSSVAFCVGLMSIVPLIGAWAGGILGALMIMSVSVTQAIWFAVFLIILQQIEGHVIYPHVVGAAVGVSSIWVLVAVFVGGSLFGIPGVLLGVPFVATFKELLAEYRASRVDDAGGGGDSAADSSGCAATDSIA